MKNSWICEREESVLKTPIMDLKKLHCRSSETGQKYSFYVVDAPEWVNVIPVTEQGNVVLIRQYRIGIQKHTLEIPGGVVDREDGDSQTTALRELAEETGYLPVEGARVEALGWTYSNPAIFNNRTHSYVVGPVRRDREQNLDPAEMIEIVEVPLAEIPELIRQGEINHGLILNAFQFLAMKETPWSQVLRDGLARFAPNR